MLLKNGQAGFGRSIQRYEIARRDGISLIELVVVMAIIAVLSALLFPAVQSAREQARRMRCASNLRQVGLAFHLHESAHQHCPSGGWGWRWSGDPNRGFDERQPGGWVFNVLPYIEMAALREYGLGTDEIARPAALKLAAGVPLSTLTCPTRRSPHPLPFVHPVDYVNMHRPEQVFRADYAANSGDQEPIIARGNGRGPRTIPEGDSPAYQWTETDRTGIVFRRSRVRFADILDGLSSTLMVGEKYVERRAYSTGQALNDDQHALVGYDIDTLRIGHSDYPPVSDHSGAVSLYSFGGPHPGGFQVAYADGSIAFKPFTVDAMVFAHSANRHDGAVP